MSKYADEFRKLADTVGTDPAFGKIAVIQSAVSIVMNMESLIERGNSDLDLVKECGFSIEVDSTGRRCLRGHGVVYYPDPFGVA